MAKIVDISHHARRRPETPTRTYVERTAAPFVNHEEINPPAPEKPHPVHQAARALALARMTTAGLTRCQRREALLKSVSLLATCPRMRRVWEDKAGQIALSLRFPPPRRAALTFLTEEARTVWPWLLAGLAVAVAIAVTPPFWVAL